MENIFLGINLRFLRKGFGYTLVQLSEKVGIGKSMLANYETNANEPDLKTLITFSNIYGISMQDLILTDISKTSIIERDGNQNVQVISTGNSTGNSKKKDLPVHNQGSVQIKAGVKAQSDFDTVESISDKSLLRVMVDPPAIYYGKNTSNFVDVPLLDLAAAANATAGFIAPDNIEVIDHILIPTSMLRRGQNHYAFRVINDSMEPTLFVDDIIIVSHVEPSNYDQLKEDRVCVVASKSKGVMVKRVRNRLLQTGIIRCRSDNKFYHSFNVQANDLVNLFEVKCKISFNLPNVAAKLQDQINRLEDKIEDIEILLKRKP